MSEQLAIDGGAPVLAGGPPSWPCEDNEVRKAMLAACDDGSWGRYDGPHCERLCAVLAESHELRNVMLCCSGTFAVELALRVVKIGADDEVVLAGYDFSGNFRSIEAVGARPVLADIDGSGSLDPQQFEDAIGPRTRAVIVSHLHSGLADMPAICDVAQRRNVRVVEDACQAPGANVAGRPAGGWGDVCVLSFGGSKLLTAGRGGAILSNDDDLHQRAKIFCERGNHAFPLSEMQAASLAPQLAKLEPRNRQRRKHAQRLLQAIRNTCFQPLTPQVEGDPSYYKVAWNYRTEGDGPNSRERIIAALRAEGVDVGAGFRGFTKRGAARCRRAGSLERSEAAANQLLLLHHPVLLNSTETIDKVAEAFQKVADHYTPLGRREPGEEDCP